LGNVAAGGHIEVTLTMTPASAGLMTNVVTVSSQQPDLDAANNVATVVTYITLPVDLTLSQAAATAWATAGDPFSYTLTLTNRLPNPATQVTLRDRLFGSANLDSFVFSQGSCTVDNGVLHCDLGDLPGHGSATVTFVVTPQSALITNAAFVTSYESDANPSDNATTVFTPVVRRSGLFASSGAITLADTGPATPYPSTILVSGVTTVVHHVTVTLTNVIHFSPDDLDLLLVGPLGQATLLMSDAGGANPAIRTTLTFDDGALSALPDDAPLSSGTFRPTAYDPTSDDFPAPAPAGPFPTSLGLFSGLDPNGVWSLYATDDQVENPGGIAGWSLNLFVLDPNTDLAIAATRSPSVVVTSNSLTHTITVTNQGPITATGVTVRNTGPGTVISASSTQGQCVNDNGIVRCTLGTLAVGGQATVTIVVQPTEGGQATNVAVVSSDLLDLQPGNNAATTLTTVLAPPALTQPPLSQTVTNNSGVTFTVIVTGTEPLFYQWQRNGTDIPGATNRSFGFAAVTTADRGDYAVRIANSVGSVQSPPATLTVLVRPTIAGVPSTQTIEENTATGNLPFQVDDEETPADSLTVAGTSSNPLLIPNANIVLGGGGKNRMVTVTPATNQAGSAVIVLQVTDADGLSASGMFTVNVKAMNPPLLQVTYVNGVPRLSFDTLSGHNYTVQYKDSLGDSTWHDLTSVAGTGNTVTLDDPSAGGTQRFYRLRQD
jgi:uncharacterized repeat protein (TIGR01451 family)